MSAIIDIYCHIFPDRYFQEMTKVAPNLENIGKRLRGVTKLFDLDARFKEMDEFGDYRQIISLPNPAIEDIAAPDVGLNLARIANDAMAELCRKYPERFPGFAAALCMTDVEGSVAEARRAVKDLGACGVLLYTNVAGRPLDDPEFEPILQQWLSSICRSGFIPSARRQCPTTHPRRNRVLRCGGVSTGLTKRRSRCCAWFSQACSIAIRS